MTLSHWSGPTDQQKPQDVPLNFVEQEPVGTRVAGDVGGDYQHTEAFSRWFAAPLADGTYAVITAYVFGERRLCDRCTGTSSHDMYGITTMTEYMIVTNPANPGGTELHADVEYDDVAFQATEVTNDQARAACAALPVPTLWPARLAWQLPAPAADQHDQPLRLEELAQLIDLASRFLAAHVDPTDSRDARRFVADVVNEHARVRACGSTE